MEILSWLFWSIFILIMIVFLLVLIVSAISVWPSQWDEKLYAASEAEVARRVGQYLTLSQGDSIAANRLLGQKPEPDEDDGEREKAILDFLGVMIDASDNAKLNVELRARRTWLEGSALKRQIRLVQDVASLKIASYLWVTGRVVAAIMFSLYGMIWFLPRTLRFLMKLSGKYVAGATIASIAGGVLVAGFILGGSSEAAPTESLAIIGNTMALGAVAALVVAAIRFFKLLLITRFGEIRQWTRKGIALGTLTFTFIAVMLYLNLSGQISHWQATLNQKMQSLDLDEQVLEWIGGLAFLAGLCYMLRNAWRWVRNRTVRLSERIGSLVALLFIALLGIFAALLFAGFPAESTSRFLVVSIWVIFAIGFVAVVTAVVEWGQRLKTLARAGWAVPRKGFRWWAVSVWVGSGILLSATEPLLSPTGPLAANMIVYQLGSLLQVLFFLTLVLAFWPGAIVAALYVRRVNMAHQKLLHKQAPKHPYLTHDR